MMAISASFTPRAMTALSKRSDSLPAVAENRRQDEHAGRHIDQQFRRHAIQGEAVIADQHHNGGFQQIVIEGAKNWVPNKAKSGGSRRN
jgi:hypothetical protein